MPRGPVPKELVVLGAGLARGRGVQAKAGERTPAVRVRSTQGCRTERAVSFRRVCFSQVFWASSVNTEQKQVHTGHRWVSEGTAEPQPLDHARNAPSVAHLLVCTKRLF